MSEYNKCCDSTLQQHIACIHPLISLAIVPLVSLYNQLQYLWLRKPAMKMEVVAKSDKTNIRCGNHQIMQGELFKS